MPAETEAWATDQPDVLEVGTFRELPIRFRDEVTSLAVINGKARGKLSSLPDRGPKRVFNPANAWPYRKVSRPICDSAYREVFAANASGYQRIHRLRNLQGFRARSRDGPDAQNSF